jgi:hypothetical protein
MDAMTFATMRLAEHRFADLERENRLRVARAERHAALAGGGSRPAGDDRPTRRSDVEHTPTELALAGPSS